MQLNNRCLVLLLSFASFVCSANKPVEEFWPGANYDSATPTSKQVIGHNTGEKISSAVQIQDYIKALAKAHPNQTKLVDYGKSWQGKPLSYLVISAKENIEKLDELKSRYIEFADPRITSEKKAKQLTNELPAVVWLGYSVHGNEISPADAALQTAYHLLASQNDELVANVLKQVILLIDPLQNPDGRDRFIYHFTTNSGIKHDPHPLSAERRESWPSGRTNHFLFDMNRDWAAMTQGETQGRVGVMTDWWPLVAVDIHEFGSNYTYYFTPEADPYNPFITDEQKAGLEIIGKNNAKWFDQRGWDYFTREIYDAFFPGYGAGWPVFYGALGMTYEQASPRGMVVRNKVGDTFTYKDAVAHHFVASISTLEAVANNKPKLMQRFYNYRNEAVKLGRNSDYRQYILPRNVDRANTDKLVTLLHKQGIEIGIAESNFKACGDNYQAGDYVIRMDQPNHRMIRNYLDKQVSMTPEFIAKQERLRANHKQHVLYDVTAWSKPLLHNVPALACKERSKVTTKRFSPENLISGEVIGASGKVAYLVPWDSTAAGSFLIKALNRGIQVWSSDKSFEQSGRVYPRGTLIIKRHENSEDILSVIAELAAETGAQVIATDSGWVDSGVNFGSQHVVKMKPLNIAMAWDEPTSQYNAGAARFVLEKQFEQPITVVRTKHLAGALIDDFQVVILPHGRSYSDWFSESDTKKLQDWIRRGGVLMAVGSGLDFAVSTELLTMEVESNTIDKPNEELKKLTTLTLSDQASYQNAITAPNRRMEKFPGVILKAETNQEHWLTVGLQKSLHVIGNSNKTYKPMTLDNGVNVVRFADADNVLASGYLWNGYEKQLAYKPFTVLQSVGRGFIVGFTEDPTFRAQQNGLNLLVINAIFRTAAHVDANIRNGK